MNVAAGPLDVFKAHQIWETQSIERANLLGDSIKDYAASICLSKSGINYRAQFFRSIKFKKPKESLGDNSGIEDKCHCNEIFKNTNLNQRV
jgi:hypothetical protein